MSKYLSIPLLILLIVASAVYFLLPFYPASEEAQAIYDLSVRRDLSTNEFLAFAAVDDYATGIILYPGARVDPKAYAPLASDLANRGYLTIIVQMPFHMAFLAPNRAQEIIDLYEEVDKWVIGGHSLGGAMAARYVYQNPQQFAALILLAAYPAENNDLSPWEGFALSIFAENDGLATTEKIETTRELLPSNTIFYEIRGGNHAQFGSYGWQRRDEEALISPLAQRTIIVEQIINFLGDL